MLQKRWREQDADNTLLSEGNGMVEIVVFVALSPAWDDFEQ